MISAPSSVSDERDRLMKPSVTISAQSPTVTTLQVWSILDTRILLPKIGLKHLVPGIVVPFFGSGRQIHSDCSDPTRVEAHHVLPLGNGVVVVHLRVERTRREDLPAIPEQGG